MDQAGYTALHVACAIGHRQFGLQLVAAGASSGIEDNNGRAPLDVANEFGHHSLATSLLTVTSAIVKLQCVGNAVISDTLMSSKSRSGCTSS